MAAIFEATLVEWGGMSDQDDISKALGYKQGMKVELPVTEHLFGGIPLPWDTGPVLCDGTTPVTYNATMKDGVVYFETAQPTQ